MSNVYKEAIMFVRAEVTIGPADAKTKVDETREMPLRRLAEDGSRDVRRYILAQNCIAMQTHMGSDMGKLSPYSSHSTIPITSHINISLS